MAQQPFALTPAVAEAASAFANMLSAAYRVPVEGEGRRALTDKELAQRASVAVSIEFRLADWAMMRLAEDETLTPYQYGMLDVTEKILAQIITPPALHPQFAAAVLQFRGLFAAAAMPADGWITNPAHPARQLLMLAYQYGAGWQPELGTAALSIRGQVESWFEAIAQGSHDWFQAVSTAQHWLEEEKRRAERVEKRLVEAEAGAMREKRARLLATRTLNQAFADRLIGKEVGAMLTADWLPAMQHAVLRHGEQSPLWQKIKRTTGTLRWTLSPELGDEAQNKLLRLIAQVGQDLEDIAPQIFFDDAVRQRVLGTLDEEHLCVARNLPRETAPFPPIELHDALSETNTSLSEILLDKVRAVSVSNWLLLHQQGTPRRARVLLRDDEAHQLLLVNIIGAKVMTISVEKLAVAMASGAIEVLPEKLPLPSAIAQAVEETRVMHRQAQQTRMEALRVMREQAAAEARTREAARQKALAEAKVLEAARQEAQRKADIAMQEASVIRESTQQRARLLASSLTIGAWLVFRSADGKTEKRRLTVILPSSGKYILVDGSGLNKFEVTRDELIRGLGDGSISALTKDQKLDDALTRVVSGLRGPGGTP